MSMNRNVSSSVRKRNDRFALQEVNDLPSRTKGSFKDQCDINFIMSRYLKSGAVDHVAKYGGSYGFATSLTLHEALNIVRKAEEMFNDLDSKIRIRFHNEPGEFLDFVQDPKNAEVLVEMGLANPAKVVEPVLVRMEPTEEAQEARGSEDPASGRSRARSASSGDHTRST